MDHCHNFYSIIVSNAKLLPNKVALYEEDLKITNQQLLEYVDNIASLLNNLGIVKGDKVAIMMTNSWQYVVNIFAINKIGGVIVLINNFLKEDEVAHILSDSQAKLLFASSKFDKEVHNQLVKTMLQKIVWVDGLPHSNEHNLEYSRFLNVHNNSAPYVSSKPDELSLIIYTSGTTGKPKGAMLSFNNIKSNVMACAGQLLIGKSEKMPMICYLPMFHAFTFTVTIMLPLVHNSSITIMRSLTTKGDFAKLLKHVLLKRVKYFTGVPDIYSAMARAQLPWYFHWLHSVKGFISGAAPLSEDTMRKFAQAFKRGTLIQGYGISECSPVVSVNQPWNNRIGSVGKALPSYQVESFDDNMHQLARDEIGEICVKGGCVMMGYYNQAEETRNALVDGWFKTGDIGKVDQDGFIFILDRKKDLIINKGMNIYPCELEEVIYTNDKVTACAVIGLRDIDANEVPIAYIELKDGETATEAEFKGFVRDKLAPFKQPKKFIFMDKLPRNATGKILKRELRELLK